jgi:hypothetical protein
MESLRPISREWRHSLASLLARAERELLICTPFVGLEGTRFVLENTRPQFREHGQVKFLTNLCVANVCSLTTDPRSLRSLTDKIAGSSVIHLPGLHAKVYVADGAHAIVTSGNLTAGGLYRNLEYGVELTESRITTAIRQDLLDITQLGAAVPNDRLAAYCEAVERLLVDVARRTRQVQSEIAREFRAEVRPIEDDLIRLRLAEGPLHTVFARTIEYLLRKHGPLKTIELHPLIEALHPDLCDNSVDRIIDGKRFGKKWKHAVRTAQQQLKQRGSINYQNETWALIHS